MSDYVSVEAGVQLVTFSTAKHLHAHTGEVYSSCV